MMLKYITTYNHQLMHMFIALRGLI